MDPASEAPASFEFGRFRVLPQRREVLADGQPMELGGRAFDILVVLIEAYGDVVSKDELMRRVWPGRIVEDNNLHGQIKALRKVFSDHDLIRTVVGRGYQFTGEVRTRPRTDTERAQPGTGSDVSDSTNLHAPTSDLIGREVESGEVIGLVGRHRFVTLTGTGGIGKTRLASKSRGACCRNSAMGSGSPSLRRCLIPSSSRSPSPRRSGSNLFQA